MISPSSAPANLGLFPGGPFEAILVFRDPKTNIDRPLRIQQGLWFSVWIVVSFLWLGFLRASDTVAEVQRRQQQESHLSAVGRMTARLAHEIKNPLGAIRGSAQYLLGKFSADAKAASMLGLIESETIRLEELTRSILDFARPPQLQLIQLDLITLLRDTLKLTNDRQTQSVFLFRPSSESLLIRGDNAGLRQVFLNLCQNAVDVSNGKTPCEIQIISGNDKVFIQVLDRGPGLESSVLDHLFEPFFSTKTHGYGLGLVVSRQIVTAHGGILELRNREGGGCLAEVTLPRGVSD